MGDREKRLADQTKVVETAQAKVDKLTKEAETCAPEKRLEVQAALKDARAELESATTRYSQIDRERPD